MARFFWKKKAYEPMYTIHVSIAVTFLRNKTGKRNIGENKYHINDLCRYLVKTCMPTHFNKHEGDGNSSVFF